VQAAADYYVDKLGFRLGFKWGDPLQMAGVDLGNVSIHLVRSSGAPGSHHADLYFVVGDADELYEFQLAQGVEIREPPGDREYGLRDFRVNDPYGNGLGFGHRLVGHGEPLEIERVDVPVRLEKRLAALLGDLAAHKRMSIGECLEETLLHSFEPLGDGVASPHAPRTFRHIEELKARHGIDYGSHASYRFRERKK
jgi:catechol 2,3-dioxygenase-like lactoylglutathione lyase family enzyme